jgi:hypothetical protein
MTEDKLEECLKRLSSGMPCFLVSVDNAYALAKRFNETLAEQTGLKAMVHEAKEDFGWSVVPHGN